MTRRIAITLPTLDRPVALDRVLVSLAALHRPAGSELCVLVVDNSRDGSARDQVRSLAGFPWPLQYLHESRRGISFARNAALDWVGAREFDAVAMVDDDEIVDADWIVALLATLDASDADAVIGRLLPRFEAHAPRWIATAFNLDIRPLEEGAVVDEGMTGNALLRCATLERLSLRFDTRFGRSGGEDTEFFRRLRRAGGRLVYSSGAIVYEPYAQDRQRLRWWATRWFRTGNSSALADLQLQTTGRLSICAHAGLRMLIGMLGTLAMSPLLPLGHVQAWRCVRMACRGSGMLVAVAGYRFEEYNSARVRSEYVKEGENR